MSYAHEIEAALKDGFLRRTLDKFAVEYRAGRDRVFAEVDERALIQRIADVKDDAKRSFVFFKNFNFVLAKYIIY